MRVRITGVNFIAGKKTYNLLFHLGKVEKQSARAAAKHSDLAASPRKAASRISQGYGIKGRIMAGGN